MGRRKKAAKKVVKKKKAEVPTVFKCPFCNHEAAVECKLDMKNRIGDVSCRICGSAYQTTITYLSAPVDVFHEWVDAFEAANAPDEPTG
eukprot:gene3109-6112_t